MDNEKITVPADDYVAAVQDASAFDILTDALCNAASLSYYNGELDFDSRQLNTIFKVVCPAAYSATMKRLNKENKEQDNGDN